MEDKKIDSKTRIKEYIQKNFPKWERVDYSNFCDENIEFDKKLSELYKIDNEEIVLISYTNISITGTDRPKPQLRVFLDEYKKLGVICQRINYPCKEYKIGKNCMHKLILFICLSASLLSLLLFSLSLLSPLLLLFLPLLLLLLKPNN